MTASLHFKPISIVIASFTLRGYESVLLATPLPQPSSRRRTLQHACHRVSGTSFPVDAIGTCLKIPEVYQTALPAVGDSLDGFIFRRLDDCHFVELRVQKYLPSLSKIWNVCLANKYITVGESYWEGVECPHSWLLQGLPACLLGVVMVGSSAVRKYRRQEKRRCRPGGRSR